MKKLIFSYLAFLLFSINGNAQTSKGESWPYGCRTHTFSVEIGPFSYSTETTLCCVAALWKSPPIKCWEMNKSISGNNIYYQYVMISELEKNLNIK